MTPLSRLVLRRKQLVALFWLALATLLAGRPLGQVLYLLGVDPQLGGDPLAELGTHDAEVLGDERGP